MPSFFEKPGLQLLLFGGKGGVGKTTCATAAALRMATLAPERSFLLVSTDPAHSLRDSLAGGAPPRNLEVLELDAEQCLDAFRQQNGVGTRDEPTFAAQWLAYAIPCRRCVSALTGADARLGADVDRYSFIVVDLHHLLLAGLPAHVAVIALHFMLQ